MKKGTFLLAVLLVAGVSITAYAAEREITVNAGLQLVGTIHHTNDAFTKKTGIQVNVLKVKGGSCGQTVKSVLPGKIDMGVMCCPPNRDEMGAKDLVPISVAKDAWVFVVNESNPVENLTTGQLRDIYRGRITNWKEVGGNDAPIAPVSYIMCASREEVLRQYLVGERQLKKGIVGIDNSKFAPNVRKTKPGNPENCAMAEADPNAVVSVTYSNVAADAPRCSAMLRGTVKVIKVDGVEASQRSMASGSYPLTHYLFMVTRGVPDGAEKRYIDFLRSNEGQRLLTKEGTVASLR